MTDPVVLDCQIAFSGTIDPAATNVATLTILPGVGYTSLPAAYNGAPGLPPIIDSVTVTEVAPGAPLPAPTLSMVDPGGPGEASHYTLQISVHAGATGAPGTNGTLSGCSDIENIGAVADGFGIYWDAANAKWQVAQPKRVSGPYICLPTSFSNAYSGTAGQYVVATIGVPPLPYAWRPDVNAALYCGGTANTKVDLVVRIGDPVSGSQVAHGMGQYGVGPFPVVVGAAFGSATAGTTYGQVSPNTAATFYLVAQQTASTTDTWTTNNSNGRFSVVAIPV